MAKRKATRRTQRKARGGAGLQGGTATPAMPGVTITYFPASDEVNIIKTIYIGPPSGGGAGGHEMAREIGGSSSGRQQP